MSASGLAGASSIQTRKEREIFQNGSLSRPGINGPRSGSMNQTMPRGNFEEVVLAHLDAAFNYARWLTRSDADADDVVQDAYVRALRFFSSLRGEDARAWLLTIVRNTWYGRFSKRSGSEQTQVFDEMTDDRSDNGLDPEALLIQQRAVDRVRRAVEELPVDYREVIVLRELEGMSYKEIAA